MPPSLSAVSFVATHHDCVTRGISIWTCTTACGLAVKHRYYSKLLFKVETSDHTDTYHSLESCSRVERSIPIDSVQVVRQVASGLLFRSRAQQVAPSGGGDHTDKNGFKGPNVICSAHSPIVRRRFLSRDKCNAHAPAGRPGKRKCYITERWL